MLGKREQGDMDIDTATLLAWWQERLLPARKKTAAFPAAVASRRGAASLTEPPKLYIGTIHSFKGAEADVVLLFPDLSPSGHREWCRRGEARDGVVRLIYVGLTRARETIILCEPAGDQTVNLLPLLHKET
jgi:superfamily I DNA/RNA helicase